jgi:hypothetical protein
MGGEPGFLAERRESQDNGKSAVSDRSFGGNDGLLGMG